MIKNLMSDVTSRILFNGMQALQDKGYHCRWLDKQSTVFAAGMTDWNNCYINIYVWLEDVPHTMVINGYAFNDIETVIKRVAIYNGSEYPIVNISGEYALANFKHFADVMTA